MRKRGLRFGGERRLVDVEVVPLGSGPPDSRHYLVIFEERLPAPAEPADGATPSGNGGPDQEVAARVAELLEELAGTSGYLQAMIQDLEAANEELQSANEEILSSNDELQSTNEELDSAKEELQSTNEELHTLNEELHGRNEDLARANADLTNLLASIQVAIVMVDNDLRIRRFTPAAERVLNLISTTSAGRSATSPTSSCPSSSP